MQSSHVTSSNEDFSRDFPCYHQVSVTTINIKNSGLLVRSQDGDEENSAARRKLIAWDKAPHCGKRRKKIGIGEKKIGELSEPRGSLGRGKGGGASQVVPGPTFTAVKRVKFAIVKRNTSKLRLLLSLSKV